MHNINNNEQIIQYVIGKDDLEEIIRSTVDDKMKEFFAEKKREEENDANRLVSPKEACRQLNVNLSTLHRWKKKDYLVPIYVGDRPRYRQSDINRIVEK